MSKPVAKIIKDALKNKGDVGGSFPWTEVELAPKALEMIKHRLPEQAFCVEPKQSPSAA